MPKVSKAGNGASDALSKTKGTKAGSAGATQLVYLGILQDLEKHRMVPGQRLVDTELALHFGVGRHAVREAMQRLAERGVVDLRPNQSASIRKLDVNETIEILEVAAARTTIAPSLRAINKETAQNE